MIQEVQVAETKDNFQISYFHHHNFHKDIENSIRNIYIHPMPESTSAPRTPHTHSLAHIKPYLTSLWWRSVSEAISNQRSPLNFVLINRDNVLVPHLSNNPGLWFLIVEALSSSSGSRIGTISLLIHKAREKTS
jgi:hypothetical protein